MKSLLSRFQPKTWAIFAGIMSGLILGMYWIPLRKLEQAGFHGMWAVVMFSLVPYLLLLPYVIKKWRHFFPGRLRMQFVAMVTALAYVSYCAAFLHTEVIRALIFYYLMPVWGFFFARIFIGEKITPIRWVSIFFGIGGLFAITGLEHGIPIPSNAGDWFGLAGGVTWAVAALLILTDKPDAVNYSVAFLFWSTIIAIVYTAVNYQIGDIATPQWAELGGTLIWFVPLALIVIIPGTFFTIYAPSQLNPGIVGLLFMTEISVGTATAAILTDEPFGLKEIIGVTLITLAGISEPVQQLFRSPSRNTSLRHPD